MRSRVAVVLLLCLAVFVGGGSSIAFAASGAISGTVTSDSGRALPDVCVTAYSRSGDYYGGARTDTAGGYEVAGLPTGDFRLSFTGCGTSGMTIKSEYFRDAASLTDATVISVEDGAATVAGIASVTPASPATGTVRDAAGKPVDGMCVAWYDETGRSVSSARTRIDGTFTSAPLVAGTYRLQVLDCAPDPAYLTTWHGGDSYGTATPISFDPEAGASPLVLTATRGRSISGTVTVDDGSPFQGHVSLWDAVSGSHVRSSYLDGSNRYRLGALPAGSYKLHFSPWTGTGLPTWYGGGESVHSAQVLSIGAEDLVVDQVLQRRGTIRGAVRDSVTGEALSDVCLSAGPHSGRTDTTGSYAMAVRPGTFKLRVEDCGGRGYATRWFPSATTEAAGEPVVVDSGAELTGKDVALTSMTVSGTVRNAAGPVADVCVSSNASSATSTDADGRYTLRMASSGTYDLYFRDCGSPVHAFTTRTITLEAGQVLTGLDVTLERLPVVSGTTRDSSGAPLAGVCVYASGAGHAYTGPTRTDGAYSLLLERAGDYELSYHDCDDSLTHEGQVRTVSMTAGQVLSGFDVALPALPSLVGKVTDSAGGPVADACVSAYDRSSWNGASARTATDGNYALKLGRAGSYEVRVSDCGRGAFEERYLVKEVVSGGPTTQDVTLVRRTVLSGTVTDSAGTPLAGMCVTATTAYGFYARTQTDGTYSLVDLPAGDHVLRVGHCWGEPAVYLPTWSGGARSEGTATPFTVAPEQRLDLGATALVLGGRIAGTLTDAGTGGGAADVCVATYDRAGNHAGSVRSGSDGTYSVGGLPSGSYRLQYYPCGVVNYESQWFDQGTAHDSATAVEVTVGAVRAGIDATLRRLARISGTVDDTAGNGIAGVCVTAVAEDGPEHSLGSTNSYGDWVAASVPAGTYLLRYDDCSAPSTYETVWSGGAVTADLAQPVVLKGGTSTALAATMKTKPTVTVTSPNGGERWQAGTLRTFRWNHTGAVGTSVKVELLKAGAVVATPASSAPIGTSGAGSLSWRLPTTLQPASDYTLRVTSTAVATATDVSNGAFAVTPPPPSITVKSPNGGEAWSAGSTRTITWSSLSLASTTYVKVELLKGSATPVVLASSTPNDGAHAWTIPATQPLGSDYKVRVTSTYKTTVSDVSNAAFTVTPGVTVKAPNGGESWPAGTTKTITWSSAHLASSTYVKIELLKGTATPVVLASSTLNDGAHGWAIPRTQTVATDYRIRITSASVAVATDVSNRTFGIAPPPAILVKTPNGGESWAAGSTKSITWSSTSLASSTYVRIELLKGTATPVVLVSSTLNDGTHSWTVPTTQVKGADYKIRITSTSLSTAKDLSNAAFSIS